MKFIKYTTIVAFLVTSLSSCFDEPGTAVLFDAEFVELDAGATAAGNKTYTFLRENIGAQLPAGFIVRRASANATNAVNVTFAIDGNSTAIAGLHYNVTGTTATIPAGEYSTTLPFTILPDNIEAGEVLTINVTITAADIAIHETYGSGGHRIQISCPPNIPQDLTWTSLTTEGAFGVFGSNDNVTVVQTGAGAITYDVSDVTANFFVAFGGGEVPGRITNVCDAIALGESATPFGAVSTDAAQGFPIGTWDPATQTLTIPWYNANNDFGDITVLTPN